MKNSVCVIIPCYNDSSTLERALKSIYAQTRKLNEIIVVNDFSPETEKIESVLKNHPKVKYIKNEKNYGLAKTRNVGIRNSESDIITFLDADDEIHPQKIELQLSVYTENLAVSCSVDKVNLNSRWDNFKNYNTTIKKRYSKSHLLIFRNVITGSGIMISKKTLLKLGGYDENLRSSEDWDLWLRIMDHKIDVINIDLPLYIYYFNPKGLSKNSLNITISETYVVKKYCLNLRTNLFIQLIWFSTCLKQILRKNKPENNRLKLIVLKNIKRENKFYLSKIILQLIFKIKYLIN
tara:strand:- start:11083 stop:11961 length:879 start_codon:yes stop_codon:yes gene_type:complete